MNKSFFLVLLLLLFSSCEEKLEPCHPDYISQKNSLEHSFKNLHSKNIDSYELERFKSDLNQYLQLPDKTCLIGESKFYGHDQVRALVAELPNDNKLRMKVVYGDDDRLETGEHSNPLFNHLAKSVAAQIPMENVSTSGELIAPTLGEYFNLCEGERYINQLSAATCSGFLVEDDLLVTAGHCVSSSIDCQSNYWVFDYLKDTTTLETNQIYRCKEIISQALESNGLDYAVIKLDRKVQGRDPLRFRTQGKVSSGSFVLVIGHPSGLPQKIADNAVVRNNDDQVFFSANLDTFGGNSGSPVFNEQGIVEGILVRGETDYRQSEEGQCTTVNYCTDIGCEGEEITRITNVAGLPDNRILSFTETFNALFKDKELADTNWVIRMNTRKHFNLRLSGRRFLNTCVAHVYRTDHRDWSNSDWENKVEFDCDRQDLFQSIYDSYLSLIERDTY